MVAKTDEKCADNGQSSDAEMFAAKSEEFAKRIAKLQEEYLIPLKEDLSDWLKQVLALHDLNTENFMQKLENGVIVCQLAKQIEETCQVELYARNGRNAAAATTLTNYCRISGKKSLNGTKRSTAEEPGFFERSFDQEKSDESEKSPIDRKHSLQSDTDSKPRTPRVQSVISAKTMKCWENAKSESFYARDNVSNFINWTRALGVRDAVAFETDDLVLHNNPRNVVLCLLEVARIACNKYGFTPSPGLVLFEKEIDEQMEKDALIGKECGDQESRSTENNSSILTSGDEELDGWSSVSQHNFGRTSSVASISSTSVGSSSETPIPVFANDPSPLDHKVMLIAKSYYGRKAKHGIQRLAEGKYRIAGKIVFVRLLKDKHVMVRVGGGWDTLQHFLERHGGETVQDISPSDLLPMDTRPSESTSRRRSQSSLQSHPTTQVLRRCMSSTPVSRSSMSSPEPWMSGSSGYSSGSGPKSHVRSLSRRGSVSGPSSNLEKSRLTSSVCRRRSFATNENGHTNAIANRASINLPIVKSSTEQRSGYSTAPPSPTRPVSATAGKSSRYPNYLQSSQHITNKNPSNNRIATRNVVVRRTSLKAF